MLTVIITVSYLRREEMVVSVGDSESSKNSYVMVKAMDCGIVVSEFVLQSRSLSGKYP